MPELPAAENQSPLAQSEAQTDVGRTLGHRYRLLAHIGSGASAHVYRAEDLSLGREVAVKCLRSGLSEDARFLRRFRAEAKAAAQLSHPNLLAVFDWGEHPTPYIVTELLLGGTLLDLLAHTPRLSLSQGLLVGLQAAQGLNYAHDFGIVHRDLKPANLLFGEDGRLRIGDFGIARAVAEAAWTEPEGVLVGTARYAAPEQALGDGIDGKADVYSLALTVIEAVTGRVPLLRENALATMVLRQDRDVVDLAGLGALGVALVPAGRADPGARPSAAELIEALTSAARGLPRPERLPLERVSIDLDIESPAEDDEIEIVEDFEPTGEYQIDHQPILEPDFEPNLEPNLEPEFEPVVDLRPLIETARESWPNDPLESIPLAVPGPATLMVEDEPAVGDDGDGNWHWSDGVETRLGILPEIDEDVADQDQELDDVAAESVIDDAEQPRVRQVELADSGRLGSSIKMSRIAPSPFDVGMTPGDLQMAYGADDSADGVTILHADEEQFGLDVRAPRPLSRLIAPVVAVLAVMAAAAILAWAVIDQGVFEADPAPATTLLAAVEVSGFVGRDFDEARLEIEANGWLVSVSESRSDDVEAGVIISQEPGPGQALPPGETVRIEVSLGPELRSMPNLDGLSVEGASSVLVTAGLRLGVVAEQHNDEIGDGIVMGVLVEGVDVDDATELETGTPVDLIVSKGPLADPMPSFVGLSLQAALDQAEGLGLVVTQREAFTEVYDEGFIVDTTPPTNSPVTAGDQLTLVVSLGLPFVTVPDVIGLGPGEAADALAAVGLTVIDTVGPPNLPVIATTPTAGESRRKGSPVVLQTLQTQETLATEVEAG